MMMIMTNNQQVLRYLGKRAHRVCAPSHDLLMTEYSKSKKFQAIFSQKCPKEGEREKKKKVKFLGDFFLDVLATAAVQFHRSHTGGCAVR